MNPLLPLATACALLAAPLRAEETAAPWHLLALDGALFPAAADLTLTPDGQIAGKAPCNRYAGRNTAEWPSLALSGLAVTRMACAALADETRYLDALAAMTAAEERAGHLLMSGPGGRRLEFVRDLADPALVCLTCAD